MPKVSFIKLADEAILPVVLIFGAKIAGLLLSNILLSLNWSLSFHEFSLLAPFITYQNPKDLLVANNFATLFTFFILACGFGWVVLRALNFHLSHARPGLVQRLFFKGKDKLLVTTFEIYHQAAIWLALSSFLLIETFLEFSLGYVGTFVFAFALGIVFSLFLLLFLDLRQEPSTGSR